MAIVELHIRWARWTGRGDRVPRALYDTRIEQSGQSCAHLHARNVQSVSHVAQRFATSGLTSGY